MKLFIIVPCYNEEAVLAETTDRLQAVCRQLVEDKKAEEAHILYVDDGSGDSTWSLIRQFSAGDPTVHGLKLAHNVGHQKALWAGLEWAATRCDAAVSIDADLQDDVSAIPVMVDKFLGGADIVYGVRRDRPTDTFFKKHSAQCFYRLLQRLGGDVVYNHADFRLMSRRTLEALARFPERNLFLRGLVRSLGFRQDYVYYDRSERFAGTSKYPLRKMISFALDGITSFSVRPLRFIVLSGLFFILISVGAILYGLWSYACGRALPGWTSLLVSVWFIGGAILTAMGIIGEYVGKIYYEVKRRPRYFIEEEAGEADL